MQTFPDHVSDIFVWAYDHRVYAGLIVAAAAGALFYVRARRLALLRERLRTIGTDLGFTELTLKSTRATRSGLHGGLLALPIFAPPALPDAQVSITCAMRRATTDGEEVLLDLTQEWAEPGGPEPRRSVRWRVIAIRRRTVLVPTFQLVSVGLPGFPPGTRGGHQGIGLPHHPGFALAYNLSAADDRAVTAMITGDTMTALAWTDDWTLAGAGEWVAAMRPESSAGPDKMGPWLSHVQQVVAALAPG